MNIEPGDYFIVTRGVETNRHPSFTTGYDGFLKATEIVTDKPTYDRSHDGLVYLAIEVCGQMIAAKCVGGSWSYHRSHVGRVRSLNTSEVEVWPVTEAYANAVIEGGAEPG
jgi:hypothetical protein